MKQVILFLLFCFSLHTFSLNAAVAPTVGDPLAKEKAYQQKLAMLKKVASMNVKEFETFTGKHMNAVDRLLFKMGQRKLRNSIDEQGNVSNKRLEKYLKKSSDNGSSGFHLGGFALGFLLGLIGVLIAYVAFKDDNKQNRIKWSWIGVGALIVLSLLFFI
jgi:hypothetical protein